MRAKRGQALRWLLDALDRETDECILWPFAKTQNGYPQVWTATKLNLAHRVAALATYGSPPKDKPHCAHSCGNGACVNPRHLRWANVRENMVDKEKHGTSTRGEKSWHAKLTEAKVREIRAADGLHKDIGARFGITSHSVYRIRARQSWAWVV